MQLVQGRVRDLLDRAQQCLACRRVARDVEAGAGGNPVGAKRKERPHAPVACVGVAPGHAPVQRPDERPDMFGTVFVRAKLSPFDPGKGDDRRAVCGYIREVDRSIDQARPWPTDQYVPRRGANGY